MLSFNPVGDRLKAFGQPRAYDRREFFAICAKNQSCQGSRLTPLEVSDSLLMRQKGKFLTGLTICSNAL